MREAGIGKFRISTVLSPAWTTDWLSAEGRRKLAEFGIAPPSGQASRRALFGADAVACPHCGSADTERISRVRLDRLQGALSLPALRRAVRLFQMPLSGPTATP